MASRLMTALLVNAVVFSALFVLLLPLRRLLCRRVSPAVVLLLWAAVALKLVLPFGFESKLSPLPAMPAATQQNLPAAARGQAAGQAVQPHITAAPQGTAAPRAVQTSPEKATGDTVAAPRPLDLGLLLAGVWAAGALAVAALLCLGAANLRRRVRHGQVDVPVSVQRAFERCRRACGGTQSVRLIVSQAVSVPVVMGAARPALVLPADAVALDEQALRHVLLHELTHIRRGDLWALALLNGLCAAYWFAPTVWLWARLVRADIETACDHGVLGIIGREQRLAYISTVLHFCGRPGAFPVAAMGMGDGRLTMERRIAGMFRTARTGLAGKLAAVAVAALMLCTGALTACQPTAVVSAQGSGGQGHPSSSVVATASPTAAPTASPAQTEDSESSHAPARPTATSAPYQAPKVVSFTQEADLDGDGVLEKVEEGRYPIEGYHYGDTFLNVYKGEKMFSYNFGSEEPGSFPENVELVDVDGDALPEILIFRDLGSGMGTGLVLKFRDGAFDCIFDSRTVRPDIQVTYAPNYTLVVQSETMKPKRLEFALQADERFASTGVYDDKGKLINARHGFIDRPIDMHSVAARGKGPSDIVLQQFCSGIGHSDGLGFIYTTYRYHTGGWKIVSTKFEFDGH